MRAPPSTTTRLTPSRRQNSGTRTHARARLGALRVCRAALVAEAGENSASVTSGTRPFPTASAGLLPPRSWTLAAAAQPPTFAAMLVETRGHLLPGAHPAAFRQTLVAARGAQRGCCRILAAAAAPTASVARVADALPQFPEGAGGADAAHRNDGSTSDVAAPLQSKTARARAVRAGGARSLMQKIPYLQHAAASPAPCPRRHSLRLAG